MNPGIHSPGDSLGHTEKLLSWGRRPTAPARVMDLLSPQHAAQVLQASAAAGLSGLPRGLGRSYGDVCDNDGGLLWRCTALDRFIEFDPASGLMRCEAGVSLREIQQLALARGWTLPVTPGTQFVTVGGAIANDVHGKNHHQWGSFGDHVRALRLLRTDGQLMQCSRDTNADWLAATIGGLGLTGVITEASLQLQPCAGPWLKAQTVTFEGIPAFLELARTSEADWEHTVAWIDCLSGGGGRALRGLFMRANTAPMDEQGRPETWPQLHGSWRVPLTPPISVVNPLTLGAFNTVYYHLQRRKSGQTQKVHRQPYFYPLDSVSQWNRLYGPKGFYQYQCVLPFDGAQESLGALLGCIAASGEGSFLAVLKTFGERRSSGLLSFARPGVTLALDFRDAGARTLNLFKALDAIVLAASGALYPAKDSRMSPELFRASFSRLDEFLPFRDPGIASSMSRRLIDV